MSSYKIFNDPIHGTIKLEPFLAKIVDTPEFQRLRHIKQLGGAYYVYPGAQHNRFEHSIGTAHLAGKLVEHLQREQPDLKIEDQDVLCVKVAGLCHDLGHGPFSHLFDNTLLRRLGNDEWVHEKGSCDMFDRIMQRVDANKDVLSATDRVFIKEMINGKGVKETWTMTYSRVSHAWTYEGRGEEKSFLYEIISNKTNGVDVDKWDYFARDCHHLGISRGFDHDRFIEFTKVFQVNIGNEIKRNRICYRDKEVYNLYEMFHTRFSLHKRAYKHKAVNAVEMMICDVLCKANEIITIPGDILPDGGRNECKMSECITNLDCYCHLDDRILHVIERSRDPKLAGAKQILTRLSHGDKYRCVVSRLLKTNKIQHQTIEKQVREAYEKEIVEFMEKNLSKFKNQIRANIFTFHYGKKDKDPIALSWFYSKDDSPKEIKREDVSSLLPAVFQEHWVQVFLTAETYTTQDVKNLSQAFDSWLESCSK